MNTSNIIEITDFQAPELDVYARLSENQLLNRCEPEKGMFIAESPRVIERALDAGYRPVSCGRGIPARLLPCGEEAYRRGSKRNHPKMRRNW